MNIKNDSASSLSRAITYHSSLQTYLTIRLLVDKELRDDCYKAYAYFRWLDDQVDIHKRTKPARRRFIKQQKQLIQDCYHNKAVKRSYPEEKMIVELIATDRRKNSKLASFILNFFAVIEFDAHRKDQIINQQNLIWYSKTLAKAVTDGIEHFINHSYNYPNLAYHYSAAIGAHITHMLRDLYEDIPEGYINIPREYLHEYNIKQGDLISANFQTWVKQQVDQARKHFQLGKEYIRNLPVLRGKIAASWYCARFESLLNEIEKDKYILKSHYTRSNLKSGFRLIILSVQLLSIHTLNSVVKKTI